MRPTRPRGGAHPFRAGSAARRVADRDRPRSERVPRGSATLLATRARSARGGGGHADGRRRRGRRRRSPRLGRIGRNIESLVVRRTADVESRHRRRRATSAGAVEQQLGHGGSAGTVVCASKEQRGERQRNSACCAASSHAEDAPPCSTAQPVRRPDPAASAVALPASRPRRACRSATRPSRYVAAAPCRSRRRLSRAWRPLGRR
jgi:hypothetical protein